jgi:hypothetical protein
MGLFYHCDQARKQSIKMIYHGFLKNEKKGWSGEKMPGEDEQQTNGELALHCEIWLAE